MLRPPFNGTRGVITFIYIRQYKNVILRVDSVVQKSMGDKIHGFSSVVYGGGQYRDCSSVSAHVQYVRFVCGHDP
jgi:hypothetical protein